MSVLWVFFSVQDGKTYCTQFTLILLAAHGRRMDLETFFYYINIINKGDPEMILNMFFFNLLQVKNNCGNPGDGAPIFSALYLLNGALWHQINYSIK